ncbi:MAG: peptidylprolyl isomerase [Bdellovibrionota bacterium]
MRKRILIIGFATVLGALIAVAVIYNKTQTQLAEGGGLVMSSVGGPVTIASANPSPGPSDTALALPAGQTAPGGLKMAAPDLSVDANGLSKATVVMNTTKGVVKFKFYPKDAPTTVNRMIELYQKGFYSGLKFHRVIPNFVVQGGDPLGDGTGGSGQKLKAEFSSRRHVEGTVAMARSSDPDSADSQFYFVLSPQPHLDGKYTVFGQITEGMDIVRRIQAGDAITTATVE